MLKPYSDIEHFSILYKEWKDVRKKSHLFLGLQKPKLVLYRYRECYCLSKELSLREPLSVNIFHDLKKNISLNK